MKLSHLFIPYPKTHKKAHLISQRALIVYVGIFLLFQLFLSFLSHTKPGVLGITSSIDQHTLVTLTNQERAKNNLPPLRENQELDQAALKKAQNMFAEDYWAHYSPSGKTPWDFIEGAGYKFTYAGENLARNFYNSDDVVKAWMASPSHRANIVNVHYQDIGMAVVVGTLQGQRTTLVVQEFGTPVDALAQAPQGTDQQAVNSEPATSDSSNVLDFSGSQEAQTPLFDPYKLTKSLGSGLIFMIMGLMLLDLYIIKRRGVYRLGGRHLPQLAFLGLTLIAIFLMGPGGIL